MMNWVWVPASICAGLLCSPEGPAPGLSELRPLQNLGSHPKEDVGRTSHQGDAALPLRAQSSRGHSQNTPWKMALCSGSTYQAGKMEWEAHNQIAAEASGVTLPASPSQTKLLYPLPLQPQYLTYRRPPRTILLPPVEEGMGKEKCMTWWIEGQTPFRSLKKVLQIILVKIIAEEFSTW